ncbi:DUF5324 family protein [Streptomyces sp. NPDC001591]|uniref:DUF5324 family protein n=1 Tax=unclassified Streptomyces TaxID=2593676 RepID=UPI0033D752DE
MTRKDSVSLAAENARDAMRHAAEVVAPYAGTAKDAAVHYAQEANARLAPKVSYVAGQASQQARAAYGTHLQPRMHAARTHLPPNVDRAATKAVHQTRHACRHAVDYTAPRLESALAAAQPVAEEASNRSIAALAALRGQVTPEDVQWLVRRNQRRAACGRALKGLALAGLIAGVAYAAWRWWDQQSNPDWLVEPPAATELSSQDAAPASFDDELAEKEKQAGSGEPSEPGKQAEKGNGAH